MSKLIEKLKAIGKRHNVMETYVPVSQKELQFWNQLVVVDRKNLVPGVTDQEHVFSGTPVTPEGGTRPLDKPIEKNDRPGKEAQFPAVVTGAVNATVNGATEIAVEGTDPFEEGVSVQGRVKQRLAGNPLQMHKTDANKARDRAEGVLGRKFNSKNRKLAKKMTEEELRESALTRLRVQRAKLKKKLRSNPDNVSDSERLLALDNQIRNLNRSEKMRDAWAQGAERDFK